MNSRHVGSGRDDPAGPWPSWGYRGAWNWPQHQGIVVVVVAGRVWLPNAYEEQRNLPAPRVCQVFSRPGREILRLDSVGT